MLVHIHIHIYVYTHNKSTHLEAAISRERVAEAAEMVASLIPSVYMYTYVYIYISIHVYIYIYTYTRATNTHRWMRKYEQSAWQRQ